MRCSCRKIRQALGHIVENSVSSVKQRDHQGSAAFFAPEMAWCR